MNLKYTTGLCLMSSLFFSGCEGGACPTIAVPVYNLSVFDVVTGETLCNVAVFQDDYFINSPPETYCEATYSNVQGSQGVADITVTLEGYETTIKQAVPNNLAQYPRYSCDNSVDVDIYLTPKS